MKIKEMRDAAALTQNDVAEAIGVDRSTVSCWERGASTPRAELIPALAKLFGCSIDALFGCDRQESA